MAQLILPGSNDGAPLQAQLRPNSLPVFAVPLACEADFPSLSRVAAAEENHPLPASLEKCDLHQHCPLHCWNWAWDYFGEAQARTSTVEPWEQQCCLRQGRHSARVTVQAASWDLGKSQSVPFILTVGCFTIIAQGYERQLSSTFLWVGAGALWGHQSEQKICRGQ